ncbi:MAG: hypothetical protein M3067_06765 [Chloroflexota bacterium]|nr:hypothetical protein [Chloroflexota bacterium]
MATLVVGASAAAEPRSVRLSRLGGVAALLFGIALLADIVVFFAYVGSTGVSIEGDPAAHPAQLAQLLVNGAASAVWIWYLVLAGLSALALTTVRSLSDHLRAAGFDVPASGLGAAALAIYLLISLTTLAIDRQAGSAVLTQAQLEASIPVLFAVLFPALLGAFNLLAAGWIFATSWAGWRTRALPRWLCAVGGVTAIVLLAGVTGASGIEVLAGPWLICVGIWMLVHRP